MKIETNSNNIHVFRVNRPAIKNKRQSQIQEIRNNNDNERNSACSRTSLSAETKRLICEHHINNPKFTQESLAVKFGCKRSTIAKVRCYIIHIWMSSLY
jgi:response regulator of citrate/malate metabolism